MLDRYDYELEDVVYDETNELLKLKKELEEYKNKLNYIKNFIEKECVYDEHLQGYIFDLSKSKVRTLMYNIKDHND